MVRELGRFVVCDPLVCHGQPTIRGTRILVRGILDGLRDGLTWDEITYDTDGAATPEVIREVIQLAAQALLEQVKPIKLTA